MENILTFDIILTNVILYNIIWIYSILFGYEVMMLSTSWMLIVHFLFIIFIKGWIIDPYEQCSFYQSAEVLAFPSHYVKIFYGDMVTSGVKMVIYNNIINKNIGKYHLPHIWDEVLLNTPKLKLE